MMHSFYDNNRLLYHLHNDESIGVCIYEKDFKIVVWSDILEKYTGITIENSLGNKVQDILKLKDTGEKPKREDTFNKSLQQSFILRSVEFNHKNTDTARKHTYDLHFFPLEEEDKSTNAVLMLVTVAADDKKKKKQSLVRTTLTSIDDFLKYAPIPIFIVDEALNLKLANKAFYVFTNCAPEQSKNLRDFVASHILEHLQVHISTVIETGQALSFSRKFELQRGPRVLYNILFPIRNRFGEVDAIGGYLIDVTRQVQQEKQNEQLLEETQRLNQTLFDQNNELQQKKTALDEANIALQAQKGELERLVTELSDRNYELDQIMYKTSQDIRAPLTSILGLLQLAKQEQDITKLHEYHHFIENRVNKLDDFVKTMLTYAKSSRIDISLASIDWQQLVQESMDQVHYLRNYGQINITTTINAELYEFKSDPMRINIILNNLIANAIKYADMRKPTPSVEIRINNSAKGASIEVQ
ncbi:MAG: PAS domain-containing protein, partial [Bacteroidetes bacterium]|nr:PAS domain-containing protein [Bacteroidota bacterium]